MTTPHLDHVTQRVIGSAFQIICEEMGHTMIRTANSSLFVEGRDFSCAIVDRNAELIAAANYDPSHLSAMALTVEFVVLFFGPENIFPGDVYLVNDPYRGGGHLPDITLIRPVFADSRLLGYSVNRAHHLDIGGMAVAGFPGTARSVFQEGLRIPPIRWFHKGEENRDIIEFITLNVRFPRDQWGDFQAQLASTQTAERRLLRLAGRYGADAVQAAMEDVKDHAEELTRLMIRDLPGGRYSFTEFVDDDGVTDQPRRIEVAITVHGDRMTVDFTGTSPQAEGPVNSSYGNTLSSTFNAILQLLGPDVPFNNGCFRPIEVVVPRGCLLNPAPPAPCFGGVTEVSIRVVDAIMGALAPVASNLIGAGSYGTCINFSGGGYDAERRASYGFYFFIEGGWGACSWRDGWNCTPNPTSNFNDYPVEWIESTLPLRYKEVRLHTDSGGPGQWRGGVGTIRTVQLLADSVEINSLGERFLIPPFGLEGGDPGACNALFIRSGSNGDWQTIRQALHTASPSKFNGLRSGRDSWFRMMSGGGGGYGDPLARPAARVVDDVVQGFVSREGAQADYGVVIVTHPDHTLGYDPERTEARRADMRRSPRSRQLARAEAVERARAATAGQQLSEEAGQTVEATEKRIAAGAARLRQELGGAKADALGATLRTPFTNPRAVKFWDMDSLDRWLQRHGNQDASAEAK
ncbi:hydantoinase B/oxoprolinase family protein [Aestuariivirga sp.]|uniref:hydantoinase B/oxoprolinase family protein n=1 Tax=Aestuariivirga sp. TaxID=2650926 RepID=UPI00391C51DA